MRTKTLLLTAVLSAAAAATSMADVFSVNVVGYVNVVLQPGFNLISNPLNTTNNTINSLIPNPGEGALLYKFSNGTYSEIAENFGPGLWDPNLTLAPGEGAFIKVPALTTNTFVGEVLTGTSTNSIPAGFSIRASVVPQAAGLTSPNGLNFPSQEGDLVYFFNSTSQSYDQIYENFGGDLWDPATPVPQVGQAFFLNKVSATNWVRTFNPQ